MLGVASLPVCLGSHRFVGVAGFFFLIEEVAVTDLLIRIVTSKTIWDDFIVGIAEVDVSHIIRIVEHIWVQSIEVPEVMLVILALWTW